MKLLALCLLTSQSAFAFTFLESSAPGSDFSGSFSAPTTLGSTTVGINTVTGAVTAGSNNDRDYFTFQVPSGQELISIGFSELNGTNHFFGFNDGATAENAAGDFFIATLVSDTQVADNLLQTLSAGGSFGGAGVPAALGPGDYSILINETAEAQIPVNYEFTIETAAIPEPSTVFLLGLMAFAGLYRRSR